MKKITAIVVCLLLVACLAVTAFAASVDMTLTASKTSITRGETITFTISMAELADCKSGGFNLDGLYDTDVFEFVGGDCPLEGTMLEKVGVTGGKLSGSFMYSAATTVSGPIFTIEMKVKETAPFGKTAFTPTVSARDAAGAVETTVNALELEVVCAHGETETTTAKEATCTEAGQKVTTCTICGETVKTEEIAKLPHTEVTTVTKEATCTEAGEKVVTCSVCGLTETVVIDALGHAWDEGVVTVAPTTEAEGEMVYTCTVCGESKTVVVPKVETPAMGDNSMIVPFVLLMVLSAAGVAVTVIGKKRAI